MKRRIENTKKTLRFLAEGLLDDRQILALFDDIEKHNRKRVCVTLREAGVLVSLGKAARNEGVFIHNSEAAAYRLLKELEIPVIIVGGHFIDKSGERKTHNYSFVLNNHEKTREAFAHPSFDAFRINPIQVLGKTTEEIPTTNILHDPAYIGLGKLLREKGIHIRPEQVRKFLGPDCPVSVYNIHSSASLLVREEDTDALADYLRQKTTP